MKYRINEPNVVFDTFDDEVILINLENGSYYSIQGVAADIWRYLKSGLAVRNIVDQILKSYQGDPEQITQSVKAFLYQLSVESLVESVQVEGKPQEDQAISTPPPPESKNRPAFETPKLERYTDMQDLLLLDPIHDVGEEGWPNQKPDEDTDSAQDV